MQKKTTAAKIEVVEAVPARFNQWIVGDRDTDLICNPLYQTARGNFGFPAAAIKHAMISAAKQYKPAIASHLVGGTFVLGAIESMPINNHCVRLLPLWGAPSFHQEYWQGHYFSRTAFCPWAIEVVGQFAANFTNEKTLSSLLAIAGATEGIGEGRGVVCGRFHIADSAEVLAWSAFARGDGPLPGTAAKARASAVS